MRLESVNIKRFRSIENGELPNCGGFNVLIGKNNSGKSNILSAIDIFFNCIAAGKVVALNPPARREIDFFDRKTHLPIEIALTFLPSLAERDSLIRDIVADAPQMKNAADGLDPSLRLSATLNITPPPKGFGFISKLALGGTVRPGTKRADAERILLTVGNEAAFEIYQNLSKSRQRIRDSEDLRVALQRIDEDDWSRYRETPGEMPPFRYYGHGPHGEMNPALVREITSLFREATSYPDFITRVQSIMARAQEEAKLADTDQLKNKIGTFAGEESSVPNYVQNLLSRMAEIRVLHLMERRKPIGKEEAQRLLSLKVRRGGPEVLRNIQETVTALLGVQIDAFESGSPSRRGETTAELDIDNFLVEVNGSGIREALRLVLDFEFEHPHILLVEEPEIHLHPALETSMMRYLKRISSTCQVFISTHSTNFLDTAEMKNVYLISKPRATHIQILDLQEAEAQIPRELGMRLSSLFMYDRLVFVEGPSDEAILREFASAMGVNLSQANVGFIPMGGVRNFTHFSTDAILSFLTKRQVRMWFLVDRDERDEAEIAKLKKALGENAVFTILMRRELENYLLCPRAIVEFIKLKRALASTGNDGGAEVPDESDVRRILDECAEKLKRMALDKRIARILCNPVYPSDLFSQGGEISIVDRVTAEIMRMIHELGERKTRIEAVSEEQAESLNRAWKSDKLAIVPGELLLDAVSREFGVRFKKERGDGSRLAGLMSKDEVSEELKKVIHEIGS